MVILNISGKSNVSCNNNENSPLLLDILKNCIPNVEKNWYKKVLPY